MCSELFLWWLFLGILDILRLIVNGVGVELQTKALSVYIAWSLGLHPYYYIPSCKCCIDINNKKTKQCAAVHYLLVTVSKLLYQSHLYIIQGTDENHQDCIFSDMTYFVLFSKWLGLVSERACSYKKIPTISCVFLGDLFGYNRLTQVIYEK